jgi:prolyl oligopeptidase PreP (S9A serine peptidase family)
MHRKLAYDDFIAVAEDLVARRVTQPAKLGTCQCETSIVSIN